MVSTTSVQRPLPSVVASPAVERVTEYFCLLETPLVGAAAVGDAPALAEVVAALVVPEVVALVLVDPPHAVSPMAKAATKTAPRRLRMPMAAILSGGHPTLRVDHDSAWRPRLFVAKAYCAAGATRRPGNTYRRMYRSTASWSSGSSVSPGTVPRLI